MKTRSEANRETSPLYGFKKADFAAASKSMSTPRNFSARNRPHPSIIFL